MYLEGRLFLRSLYETFTRAPFSWRRVALLAPFSLGFPVFELFTATCFGLDRLFHPGINKVKVQGPVFIAGNPRSGTTFMQRLMALDEEQFCCYRTFEIIFPAVTQWQVLAALGRLDHKLGGPLYRGLNRLEARLLGGADKIHRIRLEAYEEDECLLLHTFASPLMSLLFPGAISLKACVRFDELPKPRRDRLMRFYSTCLKRLLYQKGTHLRTLSKATSFASKIKTLAETFPDARFVYMLRDPLVSIASTESMFYEMWRAQLDFDQLKVQREAVFTESCYLYEHALAELEALPESRWCLVFYEDLIDDPAHVIDEVYRKLELKKSATFEKALKEASTKARRYRSTHHYSLEQFGLSEARVREALPQVFARLEARTEAGLETRAERRSKNEASLMPNEKTPRVQRG